MPDENVLAKVQRVYRMSKKVSRSHGKVYRYSIWYGWYWENAERKNIYIGRELPEFLLSLVGKKQYKRTPRNPDWPSSVRRAQKLVAAA